MCHFSMCCMATALGHPHSNLAQARSDHSPRQMSTPFAAVAQRALADRPGSGSRVYRTATSPAASMSSYSSVAGELEAAAHGGVSSAVSPDQHLSSGSARSRTFPRTGADPASHGDSPGFTSAWRDQARGRGGGGDGGLCTGRSSAASDSPELAVQTSSRGATPSAGRDGRPHSAAPLGVRSPGGGAAFASPFEAEVRRRQTASEPTSPLDSPQGQRGTERARRALAAKSLASPAVRSALSFDSASSVCCTSHQPFAIS